MHFLALGIWKREREQIASITSRLLLQKTKFRPTEATNHKLYNAKNLNDVLPRCYNFLILSTGGKLPSIRPNWAKTQEKAKTKWRLNGSIIMFKINLLCWTFVYIKNSIIQNEVFENFFQFFVADFCTPRGDCWDRMHWRSLPKSPAH